MNYTNLNFRLNINPSGDEDEIEKEKNDSKKEKKDKKVKKEEKKAKKMNVKASFKQVIK